MALCNRDQRRQRHRAHVQHALAVYIVKLEALHLGAVDQRGVRRRKNRTRVPMWSAEVKV